MRSRISLSSYGRNVARQGARKPSRARRSRIGVALTAVVTLAALLLTANAAQAAQSRHWGKSQTCTAPTYVVVQSKAVSSHNNSFSWITHYYTVNGASKSRTWDQPGARILQWRTQSTGKRVVGGGGVWAEFIDLAGYACLT